MSNEGEMILRHAWQLWFGPELEKQGRPGDWPPPDDIHAAQAIWEREGGLVVLFNQNLRPLHVKVRKGVISKGQERPMEEIRLIERMVPEIERDMLGQRPHRRKSLLGLCADLGPAPSAEDIVEIRHEMWADFPREDI